MTAPTDGRMTSFQTLLATLVGTEFMWIVQPGSAANGVLYKVSLDTLAAFIAAFPALNTTLITSGTTYNIVPLDTRILYDKTLGSPSSAVAPLASAMTYKQPVLIKDIKGDAATNPITVTFSGGELCDGLSSVVIDNNYGWQTITPIPMGGGWYLT